MDIYQQEKTERRTWRFAVVGTSLCVGVLISLALASCQPKTKPETAPTVIYADTARVKLVHRADSASSALTIIHQRNQTTVTTYGKSVKQYDSIQVALP